MVVDDRVQFWKVFYENRAGKYLEDSALSNYPAGGYRQRLFAFQEVVNPVLLGLPKKEKSIKILDLGGGSGTYSRLLAKEGFWVCNSDISLSMLKKSRERHNGLQISHVLNNAYLLGFKKESFNIAVMIGLLQCLEAEKVISETNYSLKREGYLILMASSSFSLKWQLTRLRTLLTGSFRWPSEDTKLYTRYNPYSLRKFLEKLGFDVLTIEWVYIFPESFVSLWEFLRRYKIFTLFGRFFSFLPFLATDFILIAKKRTVEKCLK
jgi:ubiquinone/menaquinone biosynthesis C-methylase UbiE